MYFTHSAKQQTWAVLIVGARREFLLLQQDRMYDTELPRATTAEEVLSSVPSSALPLVVRNQKQADGLLALSITLASMRQPTPCFVFIYCRPEPGRCFWVTCSPLTLASRGCSWLASRIAGCGGGVLGRNGDDRVILFCAGPGHATPIIPRITVPTLGAALFMGS
jgi:hypothetical protein